eukprot:4376105-Pyramimonas_sp.AAC.1
MGQALEIILEMLPYFKTFLAAQPRRRPAKRQTLMACSKGATSNRPMPTRLTLRPNPGELQ